MRIILLPANPLNTNPGQGQGVVTSVASKTLLALTHPPNEILLRLVDTKQLTQAPLMPLGPSSDPIMTHPLFIITWKIPNVMTHDLLTTHS